VRLDQPIETTDGSADPAALSADATEPYDDVSWECRRTTTCRDADCDYGCAADLTLLQQPPQPQGMSRARGSLVLRIRTGGLLERAIV